MAIQPGEVERLIRRELVGNWDSNQLKESDERFSAYIRTDALRVAHILNLLPAGTAFSVLEVGVGYGYVVRPLAQFFPEAKIFGIEAPGREYLASDAFQRMLEASRTTLTVTDITQGPLPFNGANFDVAIFSEVIEHIPPQAIPHVLAELHRVLKSGGCLILTTPNAVRLRNRLRFLAGKNIFESPAHTVGGTFGHLREYTESELAHMVASAKFSRVESVPMKVRFPITETLAETAISRMGGWLARISPGFRDFVCLRATK